MKFALDESMQYFFLIIYFDIVPMYLHWIKVCNIIGYDTCMGIYCVERVLLAELLELFEGNYAKRTSSTQSIPIQVQ